MDALLVCPTRRPCFVFSFFRLQERVGLVNQHRKREKENGTSN